MKIVFLLVIVIAGTDEASDPALLFESVFDCNRFALWTERQATSTGRMNPSDQYDITAYCVPKSVPSDTMIILKSGRTDATKAGPTAAGASNVKSLINNKLVPQVVTLLMQCYGKLTSGITFTRKNPL